MAISSFGNKEATRATEKRLRRVAETPAKLVMSTDFPAAPRLNEPLPAYFESACGGSTPPGAITARMAARNPHGCMGQVCRPCRKCSWRAYPGAYLGDRLRSCSSTASPATRSRKRSSCSPHAARPSSLRELEPRRAPRRRAPRRADRARDLDELGRRVTKRRALPVPLVSPPVR
jgi:hypothetical protein